MKKCISVGMQPSKVQGPRDINGQQLALQIQGTRIDRIEYDIKWKTMDRLFNVVKAREQLEINRDATFDRRNRKSNVSLYEMTVDWRVDFKLLFKFCEAAFPEFKALHVDEKTILFNNFREKWLTYETALSCVKNNDLFTLYSPSGGFVTSMQRFYLDSAKPDSALNEQNVKRIFEPYWTFFFQNVVQEVAKLNRNNVETMALLGIVFWDAGYANVHDNLADICHSMRKIICRELQVYYEDNQSFEQSRFFETLDILNLIERADKKTLEEYQLCEIYDLNMDMKALDINSWEKL